MTAAGELSPGEPAGGIESIEIPAEEPELEEFPGDTPHVLEIPAAEVAAIEAQFDIDEKDVAEVEPAPRAPARPAARQPAERTRRQKESARPPGPAPAPPVPARPAQRERSDRAPLETPVFTPDTVDDEPTLLEEISGEADLELVVAEEELTPVPPPARPPPAPRARSMPVIAPASLNEPTLESSSPTTTRGS